MSSFVGKMYFIRYFVRVVFVVVWKYQCIELCVWMLNS